MNRLTNLWEAQVDAKTPFILTTAVYQKKFNKPIDTPLGALAVLMMRFDDEGDLDKLHTLAIKEANIFLESAMITFKGKNLKVSRWPGRA